jgi:dTDP-glucose 4,6-dehydratase
VLLDACRAATHRPRFLQVSTDEVYGSIDVGHAREDAPLAPRSPYAAAKAAGELLVRSYVITHGIDAVVTRGSNTYGPYHHPEKLIPLFITNAIDDRPLPLYGDGLQRRDWLYVSDHADGVDFVLRHGAAGEIYNLPGGVEQTNRETVRMLLERLGKPWSLVRRVEDRPGHDRRYAMDGSKVAALGWRPRTPFAEGLAATVDWFVVNEAWWRATRSADWDAYYERQYGARLAGSEAAAAADPAAPSVDPAAPAAPAG